MKNTLLILILFTVAFGSSAQTAEQQQKLATLVEKEAYIVDGDNIVVSRVIEDVPGTKDEIYIRVKDFFIRQYLDISSVLQMDDKEAGVMIAIGIYEPVYQRSSSWSGKQTCSAYHIIRVDIREGKLRVICSANKWLFYNTDYLPEEIMIIEHFPFSNKEFGSMKKQENTQAFLNLVELMQGSILNIERAVRLGVLATEMQEW